MNDSMKNNRLGRIEEVLLCAISVAGLLIMVLYWQ